MKRIFEVVEPGDPDGEFDACVVNMSVPHGDAKFHPVCMCWTWEEAEMIAAALSESLQK